MGLKVQAISELDPDLVEQAQAELSQLIKSARNQSPVPDFNFPVKHRGLNASPLQKKIMGGK